MMTIDEKLSKKLHSSLPISGDEKILAVFRHHWFAYATIILAAAVAIIALWATAFMFASTFASQDATRAAEYNNMAIVAAGLTSLFIIVGATIPLMMRAGEHLVVTDEAVFQVLQPSVFNSKISQLSLAHVNDVSVRRDFFGTILGYGTVTIETPGEQANYHFRAAERPDVAAKEIVEAHENFAAALESGRVPTNFNKMPEAAETLPTGHTVNVDAAQYQEFLDYQQFKAQAARQSQPLQETDQRP